MILKRLFIIFILFYSAGFVFARPAEDSESCISWFAWASSLIRRYPTPRVEQYVWTDKVANAGLFRATFHPSRGLTAPKIGTPLKMMTFEDLIPPLVETQHSGEQTYRRQEIIKNGPYENGLLGLSDLNGAPHRVAGVRIFHEGSPVHESDPAHATQLWSNPFEISAGRIKRLIARTIRSAHDHGYDFDEMDDVELTLTTPTASLLVDETGQALIPIITPREIQIAHDHFLAMVNIDERTAEAHFILRVTTPLATFSTGRRLLGHYERLPH
jgi:hypothetical protein